MNFINNLIDVSVNRLQREKKKEIMLFFLLCISLNLLGSITIGGTKRLLYLDMIGTALASMAIGPWWGAIVGLITNIILFISYSSFNYLPFSLINILGALYWGYLCKTRILKPIETLVSFSTESILHWKYFLRFIWFIVISGGIFLYVPSLLILMHALGIVDIHSPLMLYLYYLMVNIPDKILCIIASVTIICFFFPELNSYILNGHSEKIRISKRSIFIFGALYLPIFLYLYTEYPTSFYLWILPYGVMLTELITKAVMKEVSAPHSILSVEPKFSRLLFPLDKIYVGAIAVIFVVSLWSFAVYFLSGLYTIKPQYTIYLYDTGGINYIKLFSDSLTISMSYIFAGIIFLILIISIKNQGDRESMYVIEHVKDKLASDIHNESLQLISVLLRKLPTVGKDIKKLESTGTTDEASQKAMQSLHNHIENFDIYLHKLNQSLRSIIRPLSQKDVDDVVLMGVIDKVHDILDDFSVRNPSKKVTREITLTEKDLPIKRSDNYTWQKEFIKILRELLHNVEKHSSASEVLVKMYIIGERHSKVLCLLVEDNGIGFDIEEVSKKGSFGLYEIKARAKSIGAKLSIASVPDRYTSVALYLGFEY